MEALQTVHFLIALTSSPLAALSIATGFMIADASRFSSFVSRDAADSVFDRLGAVGGAGFASFCGGVEVCCAELAPSPFRDVMIKPVETQ
jgi:hypothetical protein